MSFNMDVKIFEETTELDLTLQKSGSRLFPKRIHIRIVKFVQKSQN